ncbi:MAG: DNA-3-methyladenine glycosylase 2 family protein [Chloroflexota bacterium]|nr:DNA-3-methyladenine glycosylase 2 family protein [Chloroflexota bacterium]
MIAEAEAYLAAADPLFPPLIARHGPCRLGRQDNLFAALVSSIISQQISVKAADSIERRFIETLGGTLDPALIDPLPDTVLRGVGLSGAKVAYIRDLAARVTDGRLDLAALPALDDEAVIAALLPVRGIGRWTAEMLLMFALERPDVLPVDDNGLRRAMERRCALPAPAHPAAMIAHAAPWRPYRSIATWYLWRSLSDPS